MLRQRESEHGKQKRRQKHKNATLDTTGSAAFFLSFCLFLFQKRPSPFGFQRELLLDLLRRAGAPHDTKQKARPTAVRRRAIILQNASSKSDTSSLGPFHEADSPTVVTGGLALLSIFSVRTNNDTQPNNSHPYFDGNKTTAAKVHHGYGCHVRDPTTTNNSKNRSHLEQQLVEVFPTEHGVAICRLHLKHASAAKRRHISGQRKTKGMAQLHRFSSRVDIGKHTLRARNTQQAPTSTFSIQKPSPPTPPPKKNEKAT